MRDQSDHSPVVVQSDIPWSGRLWRMREDTVLLPGSTTPVVRQYLDHPGAVGIVAMNELDEILVISQYRHPVASRLWEIPAGLLDVDGEDPLHAAQRELREEVDLVAQQWSVVVDLFVSPGCSSESLRIYLARVLEDAGEAFARSEEEAGIEKRWIGLDQAEQGILAGAFHSPSLVAGVLAVAAAKKRQFRDLRPTTAPWFR